MSAPIELAALLKLASESGVTVITPNRRLAAWVERAFDGAQVNLGRTAWVRPDVVSYSAFVEREWRDLTTALPHPPPRLLTTHAELSLWERVIRDAQDESTMLLSPALAAREAQEAHRLIHGWHLRSAVVDESLSEDAARFRDWWTAFAQHCKSERLVTRAELPGWLAQRLHDRAPGTVQRRIVALEFDFDTKQQEALWRAFGDAGVAVAHAHFARAPAVAVRRFAFDTGDDEVAACARWARAQLTANPRGSIAIVTPDVRGVKPKLARALAEALTPHRRLTSTKDGVCDPSLVNFSLGEPISVQPMVRDGLALLSAAFQPDAESTVSTWRALLLSPFVRGAASEHAARAALDAESVSGLTLDLSFGGWHASLLRPALARDAARCGLWFGSVRQALASAAGPKRRSTAAWADAFSAALKTWGFPGERTLDSVDHQVLSAFFDLLAELGRGSVMRATCTAAEALAALQRIASDTPFQIESPGSEPAPVQVLGVLESAGLAFDALWVMGLDEDHWPLAAHPHPFLPAVAQKRLPIPETSREASLALDRRITESWHRAAPTLVLSHARRGDAGRGVADERVREASALVRSVSESPVDVPSALPIAMHIAQTAALGSIGDDAPPALPQGVRVRGGATVLRDQSACPFRAFARHRLGAESLDVPRTQPDALARGNVLHRALSLLWAALCRRSALDLSIVDAGIIRAADRALSEAQASNALLFGGRRAELERARLVRVLTAWIEIERTRADFEVIGNEATREVDVEGMAMRIRLDRIDRLHDGTVALIDYKTGAARIAAWLDERPDEPQLPLYFATSDGPVSVVAFARVAAESMGFAGVAASNDLIPGVKPVETLRACADAGLESWDVLTQRWDERIAALARAFMRGDAAIDPKGAGRACSQCDLQSVCRIGDARIPAESGEDAE